MKDYEQKIQDELKNLEEKFGIKIEVNVEPDIDELNIEQLKNQYTNIDNEYIKKIQEG